MSQDFEADATTYLAAIERMIDENADLIESIRDVQDEIDSLHDKNVEINLNEDDVLEQVAEIREYLDGLDEKTVLVTVKYVQEGNPDDIKAATETVQEHVNVTEDLGSMAEQIDALKESIAGADEETNLLASSVQDSLNEGFLRRPRPPARWTAGSRT